MSAKALFEISGFVGYDATQAYTIDGLNSEVAMAKLRGSSEVFLVRLRHTRENSDLRQSELAQRRAYRPRPCQAAILAKRNTKRLTEMEP